MNVLALLQQLQGGEPKQIASDDTDFLMPEQKFQSPGMKTEEDLQKYENRINLKGSTTDQKQFDRSRRKFLRRNGVDGDYDFQGQPNSPDLPSRNDYRYLNMFGGDAVSDDFVKRFGQSRLDPKRADPNFIPLPEGKPSEWDEQNNEPDLPSAAEQKLQALRDSIQGIPKEGLGGMPLEQLQELHLFQKKQRGEPLTDEELLQQNEIEMNNTRR